MITLNASGGSVTFEFSGNSTYLNDGTITVPKNSLALIADESDMITFRKSASNDIFVSANIAEFGMTKAELETWYKANMVGSTGGGGGVTPEEVEEMIDEAVSGKANSSDVTEEISAAVSGKADSSDVYTTGQTSGATEIANALSNKADTTAVTAAIDEAVSGKVDTEDLDISGKTLYVGDYQVGVGMPYDTAKEYPISTKPTKLLVKSTSNSDLTNVFTFQLYFSNGTASGSCILRVSSAVGSGITEAAWQVETPEASLELVNGEVYITFLNGYYLTMFKAGVFPFVMQIVTDIESGSTPSVVESGIYNALDKMSETLTDVITKSDAAYYKGISNPRLNYDITSGITFEYLALSGDNITYNSSSIATDASIDANNGVLGVYTTGNTHAVTKNDSVTSDRVFFNSIPLSINMYWNSSYTGNTSHYIAVNCIVNDDTNGYCRWDWKNDQYVPNTSYINTAVTLTYDSTNQVVTITPSSSSALTSINYVRCNRYIAPSSALTQDDCRIGLVTIDTDSYKLQEALDNKQDILSAGTGIEISGNVISATGGGSITVDSALDSGSTNPVENQALFDELRLGGARLVETTIEWSGLESTNYPSGSTEIKLEFTSEGNASIDFLDETTRMLGSVNVNYYTQWGSISVDTSGFQGASYEISGSTITISYPSVTNVTKLQSSIYNYATVKAIYNDPLIVLKDQVTANTAAIETKVDTTTFNSYASSVDSALGGKLNISDYVVDSALNEGSSNPVQNQALYSELRLSDGGEAETTLVFDGYSTTNYPNGCTKIKIEDITSMSQNTITFFADGGLGLGYINVSNWGSISVDTSSFQGATYEISGSTVIISYPTVTTVTRLDVPDSTKYTYKAITSSTTPLKDQVVANTTALGGLKLVKLTQADYAALSPNYDSNTVYFIGDSNGYTMKIGDVSVN